MSGELERRKVGRTTWTTALISSFIAAMFSGVLSFFTFYITQVTELREIQVKLAERTQDIVTRDKLNDMANYFALSITAVDAKAGEARQRVMELAAQGDEERVKRRELAVQIQEIRRDLNRLLDK